MNAIAGIPLWAHAAAVGVLLLLLFVLRRPAAAKMLIALGGLLLAVRARRADIDSDLAKLPDGIYLLLLLGGLILATVGLIGIIFPFRAIYEAVRETLGRWVETPQFSCRPAQTAELEQALAFSQSFFGSATSDIDSIRKLHAKNSSMFYLVDELSESKGKKTSKLVGFFDLIPVTKNAASLLDDEKLDGPRLTAQHIVKPRGRAAAVYVAGIGAKGFRARAWILGKLGERLERYQDKGLSIYTRPATKRGLQLAERNGFTPVKSNTGKDKLLSIYKRSPFTYKSAKKFRSRRIAKSA